jgi:membrane protein
MHRIIDTLKQSRLAVVLRESIKEFNAQNGTHLAASISYHLFFSLFPLTFVALYIATFVTGSKTIHQQIITGISYVLPQARQLIQSVVDNAIITSTEVNILAFLGAVWGGVSFFNAVRVSLNTAWDIKNPPSILKGQLINFAMMVVAGVLISLSVLLTILLNVNDQETQVSGFLIRNLTARVLVNIVITLLAFIVFLLLYKFIPHSRPKWRDLWLGALISAVSFEITKVIFIAYVRIVQPYNLVYGSISLIIAFLMWAYLSALIFIFIAKAIHINLKMKGKTEL